MITWPGIIEAYRDRLPVSEATPVITLLEGATPLIPAPHLSELVGRRVLLKYEGVNPTGSFKDRGMTLAVSKAMEEGATAVACASTGNTSASAAAYAASAGSERGRAGEPEFLEANKLASLRPFGNLGRYKPGLFDL